MDSAAKPLYREETPKSDDYINHDNNQDPDLNDDLGEDKQHEDN